MSHLNNITKHPQFLNNSDRLQPIEPKYITDWLAVEQKAMLMLDYWSAISEMARIEQILENIEGGAHGQ